MTEHTEMRPPGGADLIGGLGMLEGAFSLAQGAFVVFGGHPVRPDYGAFKIAISNEPPATSNKDSNVLLVA
jgi:hypothetical protein